MFQRPRFVGETQGDSILIWDDGLFRMSVYASDGTFDRTEVPPAQSGMAPRPLAVLLDGMMVAQFPHVYQGVLVDGQVFADTLRLWRTDRTFTDTLLLAKPGVTEWVIRFFLS